MSQVARDRGNAKRLGAYYTDEIVADFLVRWAIRSPVDTVLDPGFGGGIFLRCAAKRTSELGGSPADRIRGVEIDPETHSEVGRELHAQCGLAPSKLICCDFFDLEPGSIQATVVVGNPPFIRYQRFAGRSRAVALRRAQSQGVELSQLASSWCPFLVHAVSMVEPRGRLAMVLPFEMTHAYYARPGLEFLGKAFGRITFLSFREKLFPDLSEDTLLLLAEDKGGASRGFFWRDFPNAEALQGSNLPGCRVGNASRLDGASLCRGEERLVEYFLPRKVRELYAELKARPEVRSLGDLAYAGIGYVSGANDFFHVSPSEVQAWHIPTRFLRRAVLKGRAFAGLLFTERDWLEGLSRGDTGYLLSINGEDTLPDGLLRYLKTGEAFGVPQTFKCRNRSPWYCVPYVTCPDAFLTCMSGGKAHNGR